MGKSCCSVNIYAFKASVWNMFRSLFTSKVCSAYKLHKLSFEYGFTYVNCTQLQAYHESLSQIENIGRKVFHFRLVCLQKDIQLEGKRKLIEFQNPFYWGDSITDQNLPEEMAFFASRRNNIHPHRWSKKLFLFPSRKINFSSVWLKLSFRKQLQKQFPS